MKIAIFGGSFDPVHNEHINMVASVIKQFNLDKVVILPASIPPHRQNDSRADFKHRLNMLKLAFSGFEKVEISDYEKHEGLSYTYLTCRHFREIYPNATLYFMVGADMLDDFPTWKNPEDILSNVNLLVTPRKGENLQSALDKFQDRFFDSPIISTYWGDYVSSTKVKVYLWLDVDASRLFPQSVLDYIKTNDIYPKDKYFEYVSKALPEKRRKHTANVILKAVAYAKRLHIDKNKVTLTALLHDVAKYMKPEDFVDFQCDTDVPKQVVHQFLGAYVCKNCLGINDADVLNAVNFHTTGRPNMSTLEKVIFLADFLEEDRNFENVEKLRREVDNDFEKGFRIAICELEKYLEVSGEPVYRLTKECVDFYLNN